MVLYGCETWSLTLREEHRLRVFENRVLRRIFGPMYVCIRGGLLQPLHLDPQWSIVLNPDDRSG
jgi:hypothetical protein